MGKCCILYCKSTSSNGCSQKSFPKNQNLRDLWIKNINRPDWIPTLSSRVCELHFSSDMWEIVNNKKRLKADAVPTIFPTPPERKRFPGKIFVRTGTRKKMTELTLESKNNKHVSSAGESSCFESTEFDKKEMKFTLNSEDSKHVSNADEPSHFESMKLAEKNEIFSDISSQISDDSSIPKSPTNSTNQPFIALERGIEDQQEQIQNGHNENERFFGKENILSSKYENLEDIEKLFCKREEKIKNLQRRLQRVQEEKRKLESKQHDTYKAVLLSLFTEDQISHLIKQQVAGNCTRTNWSNMTIEKALQLKFACGNSGYDELLRQGFPLPSRRTLSRKIEHIEFQPGIPNEMLQYLEHKVANFDDCDEECSIPPNEVSILEGETYDSQTEEIVGNITPPPNIEDNI